MTEIERLLGEIKELGRILWEIKKMVRLCPQECNCKPKDRPCVFTLASKGVRVARKEVDVD